jgi:large subunit ribosomal protein L41e
MELIFDSYAKQRCIETLKKGHLFLVYMKRSSRRWKKKRQMRWKWQRKRMKKEKRRRIAKRGA